MFGSPSNADGSPTPTQLRRARAAADAARRFGDYAVLVMGAAVANSVVESETLCALLETYGVAPERLVRETQTTTTREQVRLLVLQLRQNGLRPLVLVSDASHLPRIRMMLGRARLHPLELASVPAPWPPGLRRRIGDCLYETSAWIKDVWATRRGL